MPKLDVREVTWALLDAARVVGGYVWLEERLFEILGGWVPEVPEPEAKLRLAGDSHHHAWHSSLWRERLPARRELDAKGAEDLVAPGHPWLDALLTALQSSPTTVEKLAGVYRVVLPHQAAAYQDHLDRASAITDGPTIRALQLVVADDLADWRQGEFLLQRLLASADDVQRAAAQQARLESLLLGPPNTDPARV